MFRKIFLTFVMAIPLAGAMASHIAVPVLVVMGILIFFVVSAVANLNETKDAKP